MAKQHAGKLQNKLDVPREEINANPDAIVNEIASTPETVTSAAGNVKKESLPTRPKKQSASATKSGSLLPTAYKLEHLKAAVVAAGNAEKLLEILHHVEEAGGKSEVTESIEAYRVLKTVLEEQEPPFDVRFGNDLRGLK